MGVPTPPADSRLVRSKAGLWLAPGTVHWPTQTPCPCNIHSSTLMYSLLNPKVAMLQRRATSISSMAPRIMPGRCAMGRIACSQQQGNNTKSCTYCGNTRLTAVQVRWCVLRFPPFYIHMSRRLRFVLLEFRAVADTSKHCSFSMQQYFFF